MKLLSCFFCCPSETAKEKEEREKLIEKRREEQKKITDLGLDQSNVVNIPKNTK